MGGFSIKNPVSDFKANVDAAGNQPLTEAQFSDLKSEFDSMPIAKYALQS